MLFGLFYLKTIKKIFSTLSLLHLEKQEVFQNAVPVTNINLNKKYNIISQLKIIMHRCSARVKQLKVTQSTV